MSGGRLVGSLSTLTVVVVGVASEFRRVALEVDVRQDGLWTEHHAVVVGADVRAVDLLGEEGHVVGETQEMLLELSFTVRSHTSFAGDRQLARAVVVAQGAKPLDLQDIVACDAVVKHHTTHDFEVVGCLREVARCDISGTLTGRETDKQGG